MEEGAVLVKEAEKKIPMKIEEAESRSACGKAGKCPADCAGILLRAGV